MITEQMYQKKQDCLSSNNYGFPVKKWRLHRNCFSGFIGNLDRLQKSKKFNKQLQTLLRYEVL